MADDITGTDEAEALATFGALGLVPAGTPATARRLGGLTNRVFRIEAAGTAHCLRLAGAGTEEYIHRGNEAEMARLAAAAGVSPEVLAVDPATGVMVTRFLDGVTTMTPAGFAERAGAPARAGRVFRQLHDSGAVFPSRFELFQMIDDYLRILSTKTVELPEGYFDVLKEAETVKAALSARPLPLAPCHCDPMCDLGDVSVEGGFTPAQDEEMLAAYFPAGPTAAERGRMVIYKAMCDLLWTLWGLIQHANGNPADDFAAYAAGRFARCRALMATADFAGHVAAVARG